MRERIARFMAGRYGNDQLNRAISICSLVLLIASIVLKFKWPYAGVVCWYVGLILLVYAYFRMLSRNISARVAENQKFQSFRYSFAVKKQQRAQRAAQSKDYKFFKCPKCGVLNRIPRGKGKIEITCPRCGEKFVRKS